MMLIGRLSKDTGTWWAAEAPVAGVYTQGRSRRDAAAMLADAFESLINRPGFKVTVIDDSGEQVFIEANEPAALAAYVLKYQREVHGLSLAQVAKALGASSRNAYARYEQGESVPTLDKFAELLRAVAPEVMLIIGARKPARAAPMRRTAPATATPRRGSARRGSARRGSE
jgi:predicted transcriptional regulator